MKYVNVVVIELLLESIFHFPSPFGFGVMDYIIFTSIAFSIQPVFNSFPDLLHSFASIRMAKSRVQYLYVLPFVDIVLDDVLQN